MGMWHERIQQPAKPIKAIHFDRMYPLDAETPLLRTSRQILKEAIKIFYEVNGLRLVFRDRHWTLVKRSNTFHGIQRWSETLGRDITAGLRQLEIRIDWHKGRHYVISVKYSRDRGIEVRQGHDDRSFTMTVLNGTNNEFTRSVNRLSAENGWNGESILYWLFNKPEYLYNRKAGWSDGDDEDDIAASVEHDGRQ